MTQNLIKRLIGILGNHMVSAVKAKPDSKNDSHLQSKNATARWKTRRNERFISHGHGGQCESEYFQTQKSK